jgi:hypothetical protein
LCFLQAGVASRAITAIDKNRIFFIRQVFLFYGSDA